MKDINSLRAGAEKAGTEKERIAIEKALIVHDTMKRFLAETEAGLPPHLDVLFAGNEVFPATLIAKLRLLLKSKISQSEREGSFDADITTAGMYVTGAYIEAGIQTFARYAKAMIEDIGAKVIPFLLSFYVAMRFCPDLDTGDMTSIEEAERLHAEMKRNHSLSHIE